MVYEERVYEIFISSTSDDLGDVREKLIRSTLTAGHFPITMESFRATGSSTINIINEYLKRADIFVIIVGSHWGTEIGSTGKSFTEYELETAIKNDKNILAFLMEDTKSRRDRAELPKGIERDHDTAYQRLRDKVTTNDDGSPRPTIQFSEYEELPALYAMHLEESIKKLNGKGGWVKGELYDRTIHLNESVSKNRFFERFVERLNTFDILSRRCSFEEPLKMAIADVFLDQYLARMVENDVRNFFFESGSSVALVAEKFIERLKTEKWLRNISDDLYIGTNNILVYLDFILSDQITYVENVNLYPRSQPEAKYGATFGSILINVPRREPPTNPFKLTGKVKQAVSEICKGIDEKFQKDNSLILMAASGIDTTDPKFPGPHVGSYYNKLFKKAVLESECPKVIFLDENKLIGKPFITGDCYSVCDEGDSSTWENILNDKPIAIAIAGYSDNKYSIEETLKQMGFEISLSKPYNKILSECGNGIDICNRFRNEEDKSLDLSKERIYTIIATNTKFQDLWKK